MEDEIKLSNNKNNDPELKINGIKNTIDELNYKIKSNKTKEKLFEHNVQQKDKQIAF